MASKAISQLEEAKIYIACKPLIACTSALDKDARSFYNGGTGDEGKSRDALRLKRAGLGAIRRRGHFEHGSGAPHATGSVRRAPALWA